MRRKKPDAERREVVNDDPEPRDFKAAWNEACDRSTKANLSEVLAIAKLESERARDSNMDLYFAWNKVVQQLWVIEEALERGQGV